MKKNHRNIEIFNDTMKYIERNKQLTDSVKESIARQEYIPEDKIVHVDRSRFNTQAKVIVSAKGTLKAAANPDYKSYNISLLSFASPTVPGGGVKIGATAQEESLCRSTTLYPVLNDYKVSIPYHKKNESYLKENKMNRLFCDDCIYSPDIIVFKDDTAECNVLIEENWHMVNIISCAAPDLRKHDYEKEELFNIHCNRARRILDVAICNRTDVIILGAFGCGVFKNPPEIVAAAYAHVLEEYLYAFKVIEFAIRFPPNNDRTFKIFNKINNK